MTVATTQVCRRCTIEKGLAGFPVDGRSGRHQIVCRECRNAQTRAKRAATRAAPGPTEAEAEVARLRTALFEIRARLVSLRSCTDTRCSLCATCLAALGVLDA